MMKHLRFILPLVLLIPTVSLNAQTKTGKPSKAIIDKIFQNVTILANLAVNGNATVDGTLTVDGGIIVPAGSQFLAPDGSAAEPSYSFSSDTNTGIYLPTANQVAISVNGTEQMKITGTGVNILTQGTAAAPAITFDSDGVTGLYHPAANQVGISADGTEQINVATTAITITPVVNIIAEGTAAAPAITVGDDTTAGIYSPTTGQLAIAAGGAEQLKITGTGVNILTAGTAAAPALTFDSDGVTGLYHPAANQVGISTNGTNRLTIANTGLVVPATTTISSNSIDRIQFGSNYTQYMGQIAYTSTVDINVTSGPNLNLGDGTYIGKNVLIFSGTAATTTIDADTASQGGRLVYAFNNSSGDFELQGVLQHGLKISVTLKQGQFTILMLESGAIGTSRRYISFNQETTTL